MTFKIPDSVNHILESLANCGFEAYIVGGSVRDFLIGRKPSDFDVTTNARPSEIIGILSSANIHTVETGIKHGTVTAVTGGMNIEITTYRSDGKYLDGRHPSEVRFSTELKEDVMRRDFTVNAIVYSPEKGLLDYCGGIDDIQNGVIRAVGNPERRFSEDALRILRALRFSSELGFAIEKETDVALRNVSERLKLVSAERIREEFCKLLCGKNAGNVLRTYYDIVGVFIPEILPCVGFDQHNIHHDRDVYAHTIAVCEAIEPQIVPRLAAFFHDIGKPQCFFIGDDSQGHFYSHEDKSAEITKNIMRRLKFDNHTAMNVITLVRNHGRIIEEREVCVRRAMSRLTPEIFFDIIKFKRADCTAQSDICAERLGVLDRIERIAKSISSDKSTCLSLASLAVNGNDLISAGIPRGKSIGAMLACLLENVIDGKIANNHDELIEYAVRRADIRTM